MDSKSLTTKEVARLCRVSDATVKRWESAGLIKSERTTGGHRRFRATEIARFQQEKKLGVKNNHTQESVVKAKTRRRADKNLSDCTFFHSLIAGSEDEAGNRLINDYLNGTSLTELFDDLVSSTMNEIGIHWYRGKLSVAQEHLATRTLMNAIYKLRSVLPVAESCNKLAICCALEADFHELPTYLAQMSFESRGWEVLNFGANTPLFSLADEVIQHSPELVCISATIMNDIERVSRDYKEFLERISGKDVQILLGGQAFQNENLRERFPANFYPETFAEGAEFASEFSTSN